MIRNIFLVARRDYLGYVTAWGFWLGLLATPFLLSIGLIAPSLAASTTPTRHYVVLEAPNGALARTIAGEFDRRAADIVEFQLDNLANVTGDPEASDRFRAMVDEGQSPEAALEALNLSVPLSIPQADFVEVPAPADTLEDLRPWLAGERMLNTPAGPAPLFAAIVAPDGDGAIEYWSENVTAGGLVSVTERAARKLAQNAVFDASGVSPTILTDIDAATRPVEERRIRAASEGGDGAVTTADRAPYIAAIAIAFMLWTLIFSVVNYLLMGTIEERSNKIFDTLLTSVKLVELLAGKLIAVLCVALTLMGFWTLFGTLATVGLAGSLPADASNVIGGFAAAALKPSLLVPALLSFVLGYLMYGAIFLALGSLCDTIQEAQTLMSPLLVLLMAPLVMIIVAIEDPSSPILQVMAWIPVFTPFLLILRMPTEPALWETLGQLGVMAVTTLIVLFLATRVYRAGAVHGAGVSDAARWFKGLFGRKADA
ncbi:MAG: ABC transporter permease [Pseudomonadota bacterium]